MFSQWYHSVSATGELTVTPSVVLTIFLPLPLCSLSSCHVCDFQTELNAQFVSHMSLHVDKEQWMFSLCCSVCDFACMEEADMKNHISTGHAGTASTVVRTAFWGIEICTNDSFCLFLKRFSGATCWKEKTGFNYPACITEKEKNSLSPEPR